MNVRRLRAVLRFAMCEMLHLRVGWIAAGVAVAIVGFGEIAGSLHFGGDRARMVFELSRGTVVGAGTLLAVMMPAALLGNAWSGGSAQGWIARGVRRSEWFAAQYLAVVAVLFWYAACAGVGIACAMLRNGGNAYLVSIPGELAVVLTRLCVIAAVGMCSATVARSTILAFAIGLAVAVVLELAPVIDHVRSRETGSAAFAWRALSAVLPDFEKDNVALLTGYAAAYCSAGLAIFRRREL